MSAVFQILDLLSQLIVVSSSVNSEDGSKGNMKRSDKQAGQKYVASWHALLSFSNERQLIA